jgi:GT2 family glycosyltransferase
LISVVITTYNRSEALSLVLKGLAMQNDRDFEVIVADDGSNDAHQTAIASAAARLGLPVTHVWHPDVGFTAACIRNKGVSVASGDYIVLLDGDCVPEVDFIGQHRKLMERACFVNGSRVLLSQEMTKSSVADQIPLSGRSMAFWLGKRLSGDASKLGGKFRFPDFSLRKQKNFVWKGIRSCNMGVWRETYEAVNGFDESFVGWGHEDADFVLRMHNAGLTRKNGYWATEVFHLWHAESSRGHESVNAQKVRERMLSGQILPTSGYMESLGRPGMVVKKLG